MMRGKEGEGGSGGGIALYRGCLRVMETALDVLRPVANVLVRIEHEINRTGHVMFAFSLAHVVHRAIVLVGMVRYVIVLLVASHLVGYKFKEKKNYN